jgi:biopolymer transport protein ExbD
MPSLSSPLGLAARLRKPATSLDATAIGTVLLTALMLTLLVGSRFVYAPGITVAINDGHPAALELPVADAGRLPGAMTTDTVTVLALKQDDMVIWKGHIRRLAELEKVFTAEPPKPGTSRGTLLIKADKSVTMQTFFEITALARRAGFSAVHIAGEDAKK